MKQEALAKRFWKHVRKKKSGCWIWVGSDSGGTDGRMVYGKVWDGKRMVSAHRASWIIHYGKIPKGKQVHHDCPGGDNPKCVNPAHLWVGSQLDNIHDREVKRRGVRMCGENHGNAKLNDKKVLMMRYMKQNSSITYTDLAKINGVARPVARQACNGDTWKHLPLIVSTKPSFRKAGGR